MIPRISAIRTEKKAPGIGMVQWERAELPAAHTEIQTVNLALSDDGGICLSRAQQAIADLRRTCELVWICARGVSAPAAIVASEQLMVDRLLICGDPFADPVPGMRRMIAFARRNLSLIAAECVLIGADARCARQIAQRMGRRTARLDAAQIGTMCELSAGYLYTADFQ